MQDPGSSPSKASPGGSSMGSPQVGTPLGSHEKRGKVILEIYETEQIYQKCLAEFIDVFLRELESGDNEQGRAFMSRPNLAGLCSNIEQISHLSQQLLGELRRVLDDAGALDPLQPSGVTSKRAARAAIGPIFKRFASLLQLYEQYVENHAFARDDLQEFLDKPAFQQFWRKSAEDARQARLEAQQQQQASDDGVKSGSGIIRLKRQSSADSGGPLYTTSLDGYLILPIQRVPRYVLLLKELIKVTEKITREETAGGSVSPLLGSAGLSSVTEKSHQRLRLGYNTKMQKFFIEELQEIQTAFRSVSDAAVRMNEAIRDSETSQKMRELQSRFKGDTVDLVGLGRVSRTLIREGELMRVTQKSHRHRAFWFHLLSDMILYSEPSGGGTLKLHRVIPLDGSCKVFTNVSAPNGQQYEQYGQEGEGQQRRRSSIRLRRRSEHHVPQTTNQPTFDAEGVPQTSDGGENHASPIGGNRAFQVATHLKTITLYAATMAEKEAWVRDIKNVIKELARKQNPNAPPSNATLFSAENNAAECQICGTPFSLLKRKHHCRRCGVLTCSDCCARKRVFAGKASPQRCCDVCRLEMDLTARDEQPFRFRLFVQIRSVTGLAPLAKGEDRRDPLARCYFALTQRSTKDGPGMRRGPTSVGHEASFMIPIGPKLDNEDSPCWILRVYLLSVGEVGTVKLDARDIMCAREMVFKRKVNVSFPLRGPLVDELCATPPTVSLGFELLMPPALWITSDLEASIIKEAELLMKSARSQLDQSGNNSTDQPKQTSGSATSEAGSSPGRPSSISRVGATSTTSEGSMMADAREILDQSEEEEEEATRFKFTVTARLRRFEDDDEESDVDDDNAGTGMTRTSTGGIEYTGSTSPRRQSLVREQSIDSGESSRRFAMSDVKVRRPRGRLNATVYAYYERIAKEKPSYWTVICVKYLYIDTALCLANDDASSDLKEVSKEALASLQERFMKFDSNPAIRKAWDSLEEPTIVNGDASRTRDGTNLAASPTESSFNQPTGNLEDDDNRRTSTSATSSKPGSSNFISQSALQHFDRVLVPPSGQVRKMTLQNGAKAAFGESIHVKSAYPLFGSSLVLNPVTGANEHPRCLVLADLLRTEKAYVDALEVLDEVFISPLMQVAHGASAQTVKQGLQYARGAGPATATPSGPLPTVSSSSPGSLMTALRMRRDAQESRAVANAVTQPDVTVLLQSVRQILTINRQLQKDLNARLCTIDYSKCIGDIFCRFAVVLKVYNAYATNHPAVERLLTPRDVPYFARRASHILLERTAGTTSAAGHGASGPSSPNGVPADEDGPGDGPCEALINFVKILEEDERCDGRTFVQFLRTPKERLNRYKRILTSLLMHTPDGHEDAELLRKSLKLLDQSEKHISWSLRRRFNLEKLQDIQKSFSKVLPFGKQVPALVSARRWFKKEGYLVKRCRRDDRLVRFWLFNDALVYGVRVGVSKNAQSFRFSRFLMLKDMTVHDLVNGVDRRRNTDSSPELGDNRFAFEIRSSEKSFIVMVPHILYDKPGTGSTQERSAAPGNTLTQGQASNMPGQQNAPFPSSGVNELASDAMKKQIKDAWLREILQCIHDIHEDEEPAPDTNRGAGETTDSLFRKTASHNRKIGQKAAPVWVHDQASNTCSQCPNKFTLTFRRHHCRACGALVCETCSKDRVVLENIHPTKKQRVCKKCMEAIREEERQ